MEEYRHYHSHKYRIYKKYGAGHTRIHIQKTLIQRLRRHGKYYSGKQQWRYLTAADTESYTSQAQHSSQNRGSDGKPVEQHRFNIHTFVIQSERKQRIRSVRHSSRHATYSTLGSCIHIYITIRRQLSLQCGAARRNHDIHTDIHPATFQD